jgi:hypothetical protein
LSGEETAVEQRAFARLQQSVPALAAEYRNKFGNEISTDNAREVVSPEYVASKEGRTRWSAATQKPAGALADHLFDDALRNPDPAKPRVVVMTAGGTGAGKTTILRNKRELADGQFVYDSNLGSKKSSVHKIDAARAAGNAVRVVFAHREPVEAFTGGVLPRAMDEGRVVGLDAHARMYRDAAENLGYLTRRYAGDPQVQFVAVDNSRDAGAAKIMPIVSAAKIRYSTTDLLPKLRTALDNEYDRGRISEPVYRATLGSSRPEAPGSVPGDSGRGGAPAGGGGASTEAPR